MANSLIDIGANLTHDSFDDDLEEVIQRAIDAGVSRFIITGSSEKGSRDACALARERPGITYATAGVHPHHASEYSAEVEDTLSRLLEVDTVVAVGECGLDYFRNFSPVEAQRHAFSAQLALAAASGHPVFLHQRDAHDEFVEILEPAMGNISAGVAHCFTGTEAMLREYLALGLHIGITGWICDERRGAQLQEIVAEIPLDRIMLETDAPYLLPRSLKPKPKTRRNEPVYLPEVLRVVAQCMGLPESEVAKASTENARRFFDLQPRQ
jgi:TatD DNase family protein